MAAVIYIFVNFTTTKNYLHKIITWIKNTEEMLWVLDTDISATEDLAAVVQIVHLRKHPEF